MDELTKLNRAKTNLEPMIALLMAQEPNTTVKDLLQDCIDEKKSLQKQIDKLIDDNKGVIL